MSDDKTMDVPVVAWLDEEHNEAYAPAKGEKPEEFHLLLVRQSDHLAAMQALQRQVAELQKKLAYANDAAAKGDAGRTLGTALEFAIKERDELRAKLDHIGDANKMGGIKFDWADVPQDKSGGLARSFEVMADRIAAGEPYDEVIVDYGLTRQTKPES